MKDYDVLLVCPKCKENLVHKEKEYFCNGCRFSYPILEGVPCLLGPIEDKFKILQREYYDKDVLRMDSIRTYMDKKGFRYSLTLKAVKIKQLIESVGLFPGARVLDIGCRDGRLLNKLKAQFQTNNYGMDVAFNQVVENVKNNPFNNNYFVADAESLPFAANSFDFVLCFDVLEHLPEHQKCIAQIAAVLKKNGTAILFTVSKEQRYTYVWFLQKITKGFLDNPLKDVHYPEYYLAPKAAAEICERLNLKIQKLIYFYSFFILFFDMLFLSVKNAMLSFIERVRKPKKRGLSATSDPKPSIWILLGLKTCSIFMNALLPLLELMDRPWSRKGYAVGFCLQFKKRSGEI